MLSGIFNYDNPVWRFIGKFFDIMVLNILWFICSIPIVTIGASTTAVYYVTMKLVRDEDSGTVKSFFKSFKENFKQSTVIWLILLLIGFILGFDIYYFVEVYTDPSRFRTIMVALFGGMTIIYVAVSMYIFPLQARFYNPVKRTFINAFFMSIRHLLQTIGMVAIDVALVFFCVAVPQIGVLLVLFGLPLLAYVNSFILNSIFTKYMPKPEREEADDEMRPLFADEDVKSETAKE